MTDTEHEMLEALNRVHDRLSAWRDHANIIYHQTGCQKAYNERGNYDALLSFIEPAIRRASEEPQATDRPGDAAAVMHEETGIDYDRCLVMCNMD